MPKAEACIRFLHEGTEYTYSAYQHLKPHRRAELRAAFCRPCRGALNAAAARQRSDRTMPLSDFQTDSNPRRNASVSIRY